MYAAVLVRRAQRTFDATPALLNQSWPRLKRSPFAFAVPSADHAVAVLSTVRPTGVLFLFCAQLRQVSHIHKVRTRQVRTRQVRILQVRTLQVRTRQDRTLQVRIHQVRNLEANTAGPYLKIVLRTL